MKRSEINKRMLELDEFIQKFRRMKIQFTLFEAIKQIGYKYLRLRLVLSNLVHRANTQRI